MGTNEKKYIQRLQFSKMHARVWCGVSGPLRLVLLFRSDLESDDEKQRPPRLGRNRLEGGGHCAVNLCGDGTPALPPDHCWAWRLDCWIVDSASSAFFLCSLPATQFLVLQAFPSFATIFDLMKFCQPASVHALYSGGRWLLSNTMSQTSVIGSTQAGLALGQYCKRYSFLAR